MPTRIALRGLLALALATALPVGAAPYVPKSDAEILETLPARPNDPGAVELRRLRAAVASSPDASDTAAELARRYFDQAMAEGDPRYVGYAEAVLQRWPEAPGSPEEILLLRGMLRQYRHDFPRGMADFDLVLRVNPANVEARAWRVAILLVQADYGAARKECAQLAVHASELQATACDAYIDAITGHAAAAYARLGAALARRSEVDPGFRAWIETRLAEMAWRAGDLAAAERHFKQGLAQGVDDNFLLAEYADFLLERGRPAEVVTLLRKWERSDTLLLRLALAARALALPEGDRYARTLGDRFAEAGLRGEKLHLQEEARYLLDLKRDARAALAAAATNYLTQREPRDALVLIEAALAAREPAAAEPALQWLETTGYEDARTRAAAAKLKALRP